MKLNNNVYKVTYKNGSVVEFKALSMILSEGKVYQLRKAYPFDNPKPGVFDGTRIKSIECIERNNDIDFDIEE